MAESEKLLVEVLEEIAERRGMPLVPLLDTALDLSDREFVQLAYAYSFGRRYTLPGFEAERR